MAERIAYLEAVVGADITQFRKGMRDIRNQTGILSETLAGISGFGRAMTFTLTAPLVTLGTYMVQASTAFDASMRNISSIAKLTDAQLKTLSDQVLEFSLSTRYGADQTAKALYEIYSAGYGVDDSSKAFELMKHSVRLAEAGLSDLSRTANAMTATIINFGKQGLTAAKASNVWARMVELGVGSLEDFLSNANKSLPLANSLGISFEDLGATAAFVSQNFADARKTMTGLAMMMSNILKPNLTMQAVMQRLGVRTGQDLIATYGGITEAIVALKKESKDATEFNKMFSKTGLETASVIINNIEAWEEARRLFYKDLDVATESARMEQMESFAASIDLLKSAFEGVSIVLGDALIPILRPIIQHITDMLNAFTRMNPKVHQFTVIVGGLLSTIGPVLWIFGSLLGTLTPLGILLKGIILGVGALSINFLGLGDSVNSFVDTVRTKLQPITSIIEDFIETLYPPVRNTNALMGNEKITLRTSDLITVDKPTSLWDLYKEKGYDKQFSWHEFTKKMGEAGWKNGALLPGQVFELGGKSVIMTDTNLFNQLEADAYRAATRAPTWFDNLKKAIEEQGPKLKAELDKIITGVINWISTEGPKILAGFGELFASVGAWLTTDAIPFIARGAGVLVAKGTLLLSQTVKGIITNFKNLLTGGVAKSGDVGRQISQFFDQTIIGPFNEGAKSVYDEAGVDAIALEAIRIENIEALAGLPAQIIDSLVQTFTHPPEGALDVGGLISSVTNWLERDALPHILHGVGYFAGSLLGSIGKISLEIVNGIGSLLKSIFTGDARNDLNAWMHERGEVFYNMGQSLVNGFNEGIAASDVTAYMDEMMKGAEGQGLNYIKFDFIDNLEAEWRKLWTVTFPEIITGAQNMITDIVTNLGNSLGAILNMIFSPLSQTIPEIGRLIRDHILIPLGLHPQTKAFSSAANPGGSRGFGFDPLEQTEFFDTLKRKGIADPVPEPPAQQYSEELIPGELLPQGATGIPKVPYDNFVANLHKGEAVLTARQAAQWREGTSGGTTIQVYGVTNVEQFLMEMKRRGIKIQ